RLAGHVRLRGTDLLRLRRLYEHGDRPGAAARVQVPAELRPAVPGHELPGLLAALAHDAVALPARLHLHPARRQPPRGAAHVGEPAGDDAARRAVARRRVDVRHLGRLPRRGAGGRAAAARALLDAGVAALADRLPPRLPRLGAVPG